MQYFYKQSLDKVFHLNLKFGNYSMSKVKVKSAKECHVHTDCALSSEEITVHAKQVYNIHTSLTHANI